MIKAYATETVHIVTETKNEWGEITDTPAVSVKAHVDWTTRKIFTDEGEEVLARGTVLVDIENEALLSEAKLIRFEGADYEIVNINRKRHFSATHLEVWVK